MQMGSPHQKNITQGVYHMSKLPSIHELANEWQYLYEMADDPDTDPDVFFDTMEAIEGEIEYKADGYAKVMASLSARAEAIKAEEQRLAARRRAIENNIDRMKKNLQECMEATGKTKFKTDLFSFNIQNNPPQVVLDVSVEDLPKEFIKYVEPSADKKNIMAVLKTGIDFPFAHLETTTSLRIR